MAGRRRGPLHGIPFGVKDNYDTAGIPTTANSPAFRDRIPQRDATVVRLLGEAGAILLGKHAMHELAYGGVSTELPWPVPRNPWDTERDTGGSSSGSGAAVAADLSMFAMGTDTGGSVRNPAAHCGLVGLKPSSGLISRAGVMLNSYSFDHCGPLARSVRDCALVMNAVAAHDPGDAASIASRGRSTTRPASITASQAGGSATSRTSTSAICRPTMKSVPECAMRSRRWRGSAPGSRRSRSRRCSDTRPARRRSSMRKSARNTRTFSRGTKDAFGEKLRARMLIGRDISADDYLRAQRERRALTHAMHDLFDGSICSSPPGPYGPAPLIGEVAANWSFDGPEITVPFSLTSVPALSLCVGFTRSGLPLSMQMIGPHLGDGRVLRAAQSYQSATSWHDRHPPMCRSEVAAVS